MEMRVKYTEFEEKLYIALLLMENYWTILVISYSPEKRAIRVEERAKHLEKPEGKTRGSLSSVPCISHLIEEKLPGNLRGHC